jgi:hypothetical protein
MCNEAVPEERPGLAPTKGKYESQSQFQKRLQQQSTFQLRLRAWAAERCFDQGCNGCDNCTDTTKDRT